MSIVCPLCGEEAEVEADLQEGQHVICPSCDQKFEYHAPDLADMSVLPNRGTPKRCSYIIKALRWIKCLPLTDWIVIVAIIVLSLGVRWYSKSPGGSWWCVSTDTASETKILVVNEALIHPYKEGDDRIKHNDGCLLVIDKNSFGVFYYYPTEKPSEYYIGGKVETVCTESDWDAVKKLIHEKIKYKTAKEIVNYIDTLR